jgi:predicted PurR-regulated permease PerM
MEKSVTLRYAAVAIILVVVVMALIYFRSLIQPFLLAVVVWYLIRATREGIGKIQYREKKLPKWLRTILAVLVTFFVLWVIFEIVSYNVGLIIKTAPQYEENLFSLLKGVTDLTGVDDIDAFLREQLSKIDIQAFATSLLNSISSVVGNFALITVYVIFLLIEENFMPIKMKNMMRAGVGEERLGDIINRINKSINTYFAVKTLVSLLTGVLSYIVLRLFGIDFAALWAFLIFIFNFIPYIGSLIATLLPAFFAIFQFAAFLPFLYVLLAVEAIQIFVGNFVEPRIMGKSLNLSPLVVILSLAFWGSIWGVVGMILSVPIISVLVIIMAHFRSTEKIAILFSEKGNIESYIAKKL